MWDAQRLRLAADAAGLGLWSWNRDTGGIELDLHAHALWGFPRAGQLTFESLARRIHPDDIDRVHHGFDTTARTPGRYEIDFRIAHPDGPRWLSARGEGREAGAPDPTLYAIFLDVTPRRDIETAREIFAGEMSHRVKNLFAVASALTALAARSASSTVEMEHDLRQRLASLGRAHDLAHAATGTGSGLSMLLGPLLKALLAPYEAPTPDGERISIAVAPIPVGEAAATTLALVIHELATNAIKYGALSRPEGRLDIAGFEEDDEIVLLWTERNGPALTAPVHETGFGSRLLTQSVCHHLRGSVRFDWQHAGAIITLRLAKDRLAR